MSALAAVEYLPTGPAKSAALYLRRSRKDAESDEKGRNGESFAEQEAEGRDHAARHGLDVVAVYTEKEGTGASRFSGKARPQWEAALRDLEEGSAFHTVIVWAIDRADRRGAAQIAGLLDKHADGSRRILGVSDGTDTSDERQRLSIIIRGEMARDYTDRISSNVKRNKRASRKKGLWLGGRPPYGLLAGEDGRLAHDPATYPVARRIAEAAMAGETVRGIVRALNAEAIPGPTGGAWAVATVAKMLRSPAFAGLQSHGRRGPDGKYPSVAEEFRTEDTRETVSIGTGVITPTERAVLMKRLDERTMDVDRTRRTGRRGATSLLHGLLCCAHCETFGVKNGPSYRCGSVAKGAACASPFSAPVEAVDGEVEIMFLRRLAAMDLDDPLVYAIAERWVRSSAAGDDDSAAKAREAAVQVEALEADLARARRLAVTGILTEEEAGEELRRIRGLLERAKADVAAAPRSVDVTPLLDVMTSREAWAELSTPERREYLRLAIRRVRVKRAPRAGASFVAAERLSVEWADGTTASPLA